MIDAILAPYAQRASSSSQRRREELAKRVLAQCHPAQCDFATDPAKWLCLLTPRGAGKTIAGAVRFLLGMLGGPDRACFYFATTRTQSKRLMWAPLKAMNKRFGLGATFNETTLRMVLPNGSWIVLCSADKVKDLEQYRGLTYYCAGIDEAASYSDRLLDYLMDEVLGARTIGSMWLMGTPGKVLRGSFYEKTRDGSTESRPYSKRNEPEYRDWEGWSFHWWSTEYAAQFVPAIAELWEAQLELIRVRKWGPEHPVRRRELGGNWAADDTENVYAYLAHKHGKPWNQWDPEKDSFGVAILPEGHEWSFTIGMDLGHSDDLTIEANAFSPTYPCVLHCYEHVAKGMYARALAQLLIGHDLDRENPGGLLGRIGEPAAWRCDDAHLGGMVLDELSEVYGITIEAAKRKDKLDAIELYNGDLVDGRHKVMRGSKLEEQLASLQWEEKPDGSVQEAKSQPNHATDGNLYGVREAMRLWQYQPEDEEPELSPVERLQARLDAQLREQVIRRERQMAGDYTPELGGDVPLGDGPW